MTFPPCPLYRQCLQLVGPLERGNTKLARDQVLQ